MPMKIVTEFNIAEKKDVFITNYDYWQLVIGNFC
jgi:hypothetical protein